MGERTFISEFDAFRDHLVPFRIIKGEINGRVPGFNKFSVDTETAVSGTGLD